MLRDALAHRAGRARRRVEGREVLRAERRQLRLAGRARSGGLGVSGRERGRNRHGGEDDEQQDLLHLGSFSIGDERSVRHSVDAGRGKNLLSGGKGFVRPRRTPPGRSSCAHVSSAPRREHVGVRRSLPPARRDRLPVLPRGARQPRRRGGRDADDVHERLPGARPGREAAQGRELAADDRAQPDPTALPADTRQATRGRTGRDERARADARRARRAKRRRRAPGAPDPLPRPALRDRDARVRGPAVRGDRRDPRADLERARGPPLPRPPRAGRAARGVAVVRGRRGGRVAEARREAGAPGEPQAEEPHALVPDLLTLRPDPAEAAPAPEGAHGDSRACIAVPLPWRDRGGGRVRSRCGRNLRRCRGGRGRCRREWARGNRDRGGHGDERGRQGRHRRHGGRRGRRGCRLRVHEGLTDEPTRAELEGEARREARPDARTASAPDSVQASRAAGLAPGPAPTASDRARAATTAAAARRAAAKERAAAALAQAKAQGSGRPEAAATDRATPHVAPTHPTRPATSGKSAAAKPSTAPTTANAPATGKPTTTPVVPPSPTPATPSTKKARPPQADRDQRDSPANADAGSPATAGRK